MFHNKCGNRIKFTNDNKTATRCASEFNFGLVFSSEPLSDDQLFQFRIDKKIYSWTGGLEVGVTTCDPDNINVPSSAVDLKTETWLLVGKTVIKDGKTIVENYSLNLDKLNEGDKLGILRTSQGELEFYMNGVSYGIAACNIPSNVFAVIDVYGKVSQITITPPFCDGADCLCNASYESGCDSSLDLSLDIPSSNIVLLHMPAPHSSSSSQLLPATTVPNKTTPHERMKFHHRTGALVKLSSSGRSAERLRPMDEFNNAVVMSYKPLIPDNMFEIRIDRLVDKWSGSIEVGVTCHDPTSLDFPATMTNMRSGTVMMSGCGILTNGKGTKRQYGQYNLDQLRVGDRIGMMLKSNGDLHYFINGMDQGIAASSISLTVWAVVDLYGMTVKITIVDRDEREEQNLITRRNTFLKENSPFTSDNGEDEIEDQLKFHHNCGSLAAVINNGLTALRPNAIDDFNNAVVLSNRPLKINELFEVRLDKIISKWTGSIEIGVTTHGPSELEHPSTMTNVRSGTWVMTGSAVMHNGQSVIDDYGVNLDRLSAGDRVGVVIRDGGSLHFLVNGVDQGEAGTGLPSGLYAVVDLYGQASQASIVQQCPSCSPTTNPPTNLMTDIHFHSLHGRNARVSNNGLTASRPRAMTEFNEAIVITNRPLQPGEMFSVILERIVDRWTGSIEAGVTAISPSELELPGTMTDLDHDTWMLSGFAVMKDGVTLTQGYSLDLDKVSQGSIIGIKRHDNATLHFYLDGVDMGEACQNIPERIYPCIDLYGRCAQVSIVCNDVSSCHDDAVLSSSSLHESLVAVSASQTPHNLHQSQSETTVTATVSLPNSNTHHTLHKLYCWSRGVREEFTELHSGQIGITTLPLVVGQPVEFMISGMYMSHQASCLSIGITTTPSLSDPISQSLATLSHTTYYIQGRDIYKTGGDLVKTGFSTSLDWLRPGCRISLKRTRDSTVRLYLNSVDQGVIAHSLPKRLYALVHVMGSTTSVKIVSKAWLGEAPLASLDAESPSDKRVECDAYNEKCCEDLEKSLDDDELLSEVHDQETLMSVVEVGTSANNPAVNNIPSTSFGPSTPHLNQGVQCESNEGSAPHRNTPANGFHELHGRNIQLSIGRLAAKRVSSYNQGIVLAAQPLSKNNPIFQVRIDGMNTRWMSSLAIGVTSQCTVTSSLPVSSLCLKRETYLVSCDTVYHNTHPVSRLSVDLNSLSVNTTIGLYLDSDNHLYLLVNAVQYNPPLTTLPSGKHYLPLVDLYGMCDQISIAGSCRPSEWSWPCSRMTSSWGDTLSPSCSSTGPNRSKSDKMNENIQFSLSTQAHKWNSVGELNTVGITKEKPLVTVGSDVMPVCSLVIGKNKCELLSAAIALKHSLMLPWSYLSDEIECFCNKCACSAAGTMSNSFKSNVKHMSWKAWSRHVLNNNSMSVQPTSHQSKWHKAYSPPIPLSAIRSVLDAQRLLTPVELRLSRGYGKCFETKDDSEHLTVSPSLSHAVLLDQSLITPSSSTFKYQSHELYIIAVFELLIRPGCYKICENQSSRMQSQTSCIEWITKEKDSTILQALLLHISENEDLPT